MPEPPHPPPVGGERPLLFPVGRFVGTLPDGATGHHHEISLGATVHELPDLELAGWASAHGAPQEAGAPDRWTRDTVERHLREQGIVQAGEVIDGLLSRGLLVEVPTEGASAVAFARSHRVVPTLYGLGNSSEHPWRYAIGLLGQELVQVGRPVFELWAWGHLDGDVWRACESFAEQERDAGGTDPAVCDPHRVLAGFLGALHPLLAAQAAYLDGLVGGTG